MASEHKPKPVKTGVRRGGGPPPGYRWHVDILDRSHAEARGFLDDDQYDHVSRQVREVALYEEPTTCPTVDVRDIDSFYEIRDKGGVLKKINVRVFFGLDRPSRTIVVLGAINKKNDGHTPDHTRVLMRYRLRQYLIDTGRAKP